MRRGRMVVVVVVVVEGGEGEIDGSMMIDDR